MDSKTIKTLVKTVLLTLVISFIIDKVVFFCMNTISDKVMSGQAIGKLNQFLTLKDSTNLLVFGNSRANHHVDVDLFDKNAFNIGIDGSGIAQISTLINTLKKDNTQTIFVHIDTKDFFEEGYDGSDIRSLKTKYNRNDKISDALEESKHISILQKFYYCMNYNGNAIGIIKNYFRPKYDYKTYNGYDPLNVSVSQKSKRDIILAAKENTNCVENNATANPIALDYLKQIKQFAEKSNKNFIFITSPMHNDACKNDNIILNKIMKDNNLIYWDFTNLYKSKKDNSFWKDKTHMSQKGAEAFSKHLLNKYNTLKN